MEWGDQPPHTTTYDQVLAVSKHRLLLYRHPPHVNKNKTYTTLITILILKKQNKKKGIHEITYVRKKAY